MKDIERDDFKQWLSRNTKLSERSIRDVASRAKRGLNMIKDSDDKLTNEHINSLLRSKEYLKLSMSVKSQVKRSLEYYIKFKSI